MIALPAELADAPDGARRALDDVDREGRRVRVPRVALVARPLPAVGHLAARPRGAVGDAAGRPRGAVADAAEHVLADAEGAAQEAAVVLLLRRGRRWRGRRRVGRGGGDRRERRGGRARGLLGAVVGLLAGRAGGARVGVGGVEAVAHPRDGRGVGVLLDHQDAERGRRAGRGDQRVGELGARAVGLLLGGLELGGVAAQGAGRLAEVPVGVAQRHRGGERGGAGGERRDAGPRHAGRRARDLGRPARSSWPPAAVRPAAPARRPSGSPGSPGSRRRLRRSRITGWRSGR